MRRSLPVHCAPPRELRVELLAEEASILLAPTAGGRHAAAYAPHPEAAAAGRGARQQVLTMSLQRTRSVLPVACSTAGCDHCPPASGPPRALPACILAPTPPQQSLVVVLLLMVCMHAPVCLHTVRMMCDRRLAPRTLRDGARCAASRDALDSPVRAVVGSTGFQKAAAHKSHHTVTSIRLLLGDQLTRAEWGPAGGGDHRPPSHLCPLPGHPTVAASWLCFQLAASPSGYARVRGSLMRWSTGLVPHGACRAT
jgi:hypothetical protein